MENKSKPSAFARALQIPSFRNSLIATIISTIACFVIAYCAPRWQYANSCMMMCGVISVFTCQHFTRILTAIRWEDNRSEYEDEE